MVFLHCLFQVNVSSQPATGNNYKSANFRHAANPYSERIHEVRDAHQSRIAMAWAAVAACDE
jgi:hypothetical protein